MYRRFEGRGTGLFMAALFLSGAVALSAAGCGGDGGVACGEGLTTCGDACVDARVDPQNCGGCGVACVPGQSCEASQCVSQCSAGLTSCGGSCVDLEADAQHCGACGQACAADEVCDAGQCALDCSPGTTACGDACVSLLDDPQHCGSCDRACAPGQACEGGECVCPPGLTICDGACVDTQTDPLHCGACANACSGASTCLDGGCTCGDATCGVCDVVEIGDTVPQEITGTTAQATDGHAPSCGGAGSREVAYRFTAPADGSYIFDTTEAGFDSVVVVRDSACAELGCNNANPWLGGFDALLEVDLVAGQQVFAIVDGVDGAAGPFTLRVNRSSCPTGDLGSTVPAAVSADTMLTGDSVSPSCAGGVSPDATYTFTAPTDGVYVFSTAASFFTSVIALYDGGCGGPEIACSNNASLESPNLIHPLAAGQTVVIAVQSAYTNDADEFELTVGMAPPCPETDLGMMVPQSVAASTQGAIDVLRPSCAHSGTYGGELTYSFTAPADGVYAFTSPGSFPDELIALYDGTCGGPELGCRSGPSHGSALVTAPLTAGQTVVVLLENGYGIADDVALDIFEVPPCPAADLGSALPATVMGTTMGLHDVLAPSCGLPGSPEMTYSFTAPADGSYTFSTAGSTFDTVLSVREAACDGWELDCNNDHMGDQTSQVTVSLTAGQTVIVVVEGYYDFHYGAFTLTVTAN